MWFFNTMKVGVSSPTNKNYWLFTQHY